jgi:restriction system protein
MWVMQDLVAGLLQATGYQVRVSPPGPDGGIDVLAHKDAFGKETYTL